MIKKESAETLFGKAAYILGCKNKSCKEGFSIFNKLSTVRPRFLKYFVYDRVNERCNFHLH